MTVEEAIEILKRNGRSNRVIVCWVNEAYVSDKIFSPDEIKAMNLLREEFITLSDHDFDRLIYKLYGFTEK